MILNNDLHTYIITFGEIWCFGVLVAKKLSHQSTKTQNNTKEFV